MDTQGPIKALIRLYGLSQHPLHAFLDYALEEALLLTSSAVGYIYFYNENSRLFTLYSWSNSVMDSCTLVEKRATYELEHTGIWGEAVRGRGPILVNDFSAHNPLKKGYPEGHVPLKKFLSVPIFQDRLIVAVVGVGNKASDYTPDDVQFLELFAQGVWAVVARKQAEDELKADKELRRFQYTMNEVPTPVSLMNVEGQYLWCNEACLEFFGVKSESFQEKTPHDLFEPAYAQQIEAYRQALLAGRVTTPLLAEVVARGGERRSVIVNKSLFRGGDGTILGLVGALTDITESKRLERALAQALEFNKTILEHAPVGIAVYGAKTGACALANRFLADLLGGTVEALREHNFRKLASWRDSGRLALAEQALASGAVVKADKYYVSSFGEEVYLECTFVAVVIDGEPYLLRVDKDISLQKQMEAERNDRLEFIQALADAIPSPVYFMNVDGRILWCNTAIKKYFGGEDIVGKMIQDLFKSDDLLFHIDKEREMYEQNAPVSYEYEMGTIAGEARALIFHKAPLRNSTGSIIGLIGVFTDVTERKCIEENLRQSEDVLRKILTGIRAGIFIVDPHTHLIVEVNSIAEDIFGIQKNELVGKACKSIKWVRAASGEVVDQCPLLQGNMVNEEFNIERPDGSTVPVIKTVISANRAGQLLFYEIIFDMTARKALERQLVLAQRLESIGGLAAGIAHEINTPIQYVGDNLSFLEGAFADLTAVVRSFQEPDMTMDAGRPQPGSGTGAAEPDTTVDGGRPQPGSENGQAESGVSVDAGGDLDFILEEVPKALSQSREGVAHVAAIVRAMKRFSHPGGEEKTLINVQTAIENTVLVSRNEWKYHAELRLDLDPDLPTLPCFPGDFNQVLLNLLVNAGHAISEKHTADDPKGLITVTTRQEGDSFLLSVTDTGCGIPEKNLHRVFDPFFTTKEVGKGTGQGLALVHDAMRKHDGSVEVASKLGEGTTFTLRFPLTQLKKATA